MLLTSEEIITALESLGGEDIKQVTVNGKLDTITELVVVTGRSSRHMRMMGDALVAAVSSGACSGSSIMIWE